MDAACGALALFGRFHRNDPAAIQAFEYMNGMGMSFVLRHIPGTQGDTLKAVQNLPGVARSPYGGGLLVVWGSAPQDTRVYVDGVHVPLLYHGGGYRSILPSNFVKSVELVPVPAPGRKGHASFRSMGLL